jgi:cytochrome c oxidase subunit 2
MRTRKPPFPLSLRLCGTVLAAVLLTGCGGQQSVLAPKSHQSRDIATLFWWMTGGAAVGLGLIVLLLLLAWKRRDRRGIGADSEGDKPGERFSWYVVVGLGVALPIVLLSSLFVVADVFVIRTTEAPAASATRMTIEVIGHQWWWEVRYPGTAAVAANEIHIPVRTPVRVEVRTDDVIHSFWVPELNRKIDTIPGRHNDVELYADAVGRYRGACSEFCGVQHAYMAMYVFADPPAVFHRWLAAQAASARAPAGALAEQGERAFTGGSCASCHTVRGTSAQGSVGPDLTHVASRTTLGALALPNDRRSLLQWIADSQRSKPGNQMPPTHVPAAELKALVAYVAGLR